MSRGMHGVNISEAKARLTQLVKRVLAGEDVVIAGAGEPPVRLTAYQPDLTRGRAVSCGGGSGSPTTSTPPIPSSNGCSTRGRCEAPTRHPHRLVVARAVRRGPRRRPGRDRQPKECRLLQRASILEIAANESAGKLKLTGDFRERLTACRFTDLSVSVSHADAVRHLPLHHRDPFDRLLIAQARVEGLTLVTRDAGIGRYEIPVLAA